METSLSQSVVRLGTEEMLSIDAAVGGCLVVFQGKVWITQHGDLADYVLSSGETFTFDHAGKALVEALVPTSLVVLGEATATPDAIGYEAAWPPVATAQPHWTAEQLREQASVLRARTSRETVRKAWSSLVTLARGSASPLRHAA